MSNMLGTVVPVKEVVRRAHARIPVLLDGAQAGFTSTRVQDIGCDSCLTVRKLYGPTASLRQIPAARRHAAVQWRRDDPRYSRTASPMASRRTNSRPERPHRAGDRAWGRHRHVNSIGKARSGRTRALLQYATERLREITPPRGQSGTGQGPHRVSWSKAPIPTSRKPSSIAQAWSCAFKPIASCRCSPASVSATRRACRLRPIMRARR
jgi:cysteine desulfurase/selenocysteine lyase